MQSYKEKYGQWALVLGATEGIGRAGAIELAHRGMDIILVGRREDKLHELAEFIKSDSGHGAMVMEYDLALPGYRGPPAARHRRPGDRPGVLCGQRMLRGALCSDPLRGL